MNDLIPVCPHCKDNNIKSGSKYLYTTRTMLGWIPKYDEDGKRIDKGDPNKSLHVYECTHGHGFTIQEQYDKMIEIKLIERKYK